MPRKRTRKKIKANLKERLIKKKTGGGVATKTLATGMAGAGAALAGASIAAKVKKKVDTAIRRRTTEPLKDGDTPVYKGRGRYNTRAAKGAAGHTKYKGLRHKRLASIRRSSEEVSNYKGKAKQIASNINEAKSSSPKETAKAMRKIEGNLSFAENAKVKGRRKKRPEGSETIRERMFRIRRAARNRRIGERDQRKRRTFMSGWGGGSSLGHGPKKKK